MLNSKINNAERLGPTVRKSLRRPIVLGSRSTLKSTRKISPDFVS